MNDIAKARRLLGPELGGILVSVAQLESAARQAYCYLLASDLPPETKVKRAIQALRKADFDDSKQLHPTCRQCGQTLDIADDPLLCGSCLDAGMEADEEERRNK